MFLIPEDWYAIKHLKKKGRGVFARRDIEPGTVIGDYLGILTHPDEDSEKEFGLYEMGGGEKYDIKADAKIKGVHFINHSCSNNCDVYPYQGHLLFFALRKIFKGEELSINYWLYAPDEDETTCNLHACYCGNKICTGTMHNAGANFGSWEKFMKKKFGLLYGKLPGKYGSPLPPLKNYPHAIEPDRETIYRYDLFGYEKKSPAVYEDAKLPSSKELRKRIRETGRRLFFKKLEMIVYGENSGILLIEQTK